MPCIPPAVHHKVSRLNFLVQQRCHASPCISSPLPHKMHRSIYPPRLQAGTRAVCHQPHPPCALPGIKGHDAERLCSPRHDFPARGVCLFPLLLHVNCYKDRGTPQRYPPARDVCLLGLFSFPRHVIVTETGECHGMISQQEMCTCFRCHLLLLSQGQGNATA
jgi:hypothetical protein